MTNKDSCCRSLIFNVQLIQGDFMNRNNNFNLQPATMGFVTKCLIGAMVLVWMILNSKPELSSFFAFSPQFVLSGKVSSMILYPLVEASLISIVFQGLMLFFIGSQYEAELGRNKFIKLLVVTTISGSIFGLIMFLVFSVNVTLTSIYGFIFALFLLHASRSPNSEVRFFFVFKMKMVTMIYISLGLMVLTGVFQSQHSVWASLFSIVAGYSYIKGFRSLKFLLPESLSRRIKTRNRNVRNNGSTYKKDNVIRINKPKGPPRT
jgi:membrane associated rhomboid family serine protease